MILFLIVLIFLGVFFGIFLAGGLFFRKENYSGNRILTVLMLIITTALTEIPFIEMDIISRYPSLWIFYRSITFILAPLFYLYIKAFTSRKNRIKLFHLLHLIPALGVIVISKIFSLENNISIMNIYIPLALHIQGVFYLIPMFTSLNDYRKKIKNYFSEISELRLSWMKLLLVFFILVFSISLILTLIDLFKISVPVYLWSVTSLLALLFFYFTAYYTIHQPEIFSKIKEMENTLGDSAGNNENYAPEDKKELLKRLTDHMESSKPYKDNNLTLSKLAEELSIPPHKLTSVLASSEKHNFYSFVNCYRVNDVKTLLGDHNLKNKTVLDLAFEAGFNSKSNFNEIFKKSEGLTPSQYRYKLK